MLLAHEKVFVLVTCLSLVSWPFSAPAHADVALPEEISFQLRNEGFRALRRDEIDTKSCGTDSEQDTRIAADFDGNGRLDYAILVDVGTRLMMWKGETFEYHLVWLLVFLQESTGLFEKVFLAGYDAGLPTIDIIALQPPGRVREWPGFSIERYYTLKNPGIRAIRCESAEAVYYWDSGEFTIFYVSD